MAIELEKVLTISAQEYVGPGIPITSKYDVHGVHILRLGTDTFGNKVKGALEAFAEQVPASAEVVVGFQDSTSATGQADPRSSETDRRMFYVQMSGTALIPRS